MRKFPRGSRIGIGGAIIIVAVILLISGRRNDAISITNPGLGCNPADRKSTLSTSVAAARDLNLSLLVSRRPDWMKSLTNDWESIYVISSNNVCKLFSQDVSLFGILNGGGSDFPAILVSPLPPAWAGTQEAWQHSDAGSSNGLSFIPLASTVFDGRNNALLSALNKSTSLPIDYHAPLYSAIDRTILPLCKFTPGGIVVRRGNGEESQFLIVSTGCPVAYYGKFKNDTFVVELKTGSLRPALQGLLKKELSY